MSLYPVGFYPEWIIIPGGISPGCIGSLAAEPMPDPDEQELVPTGPADHRLATRSSNLSKDPVQPWVIPPFDLMKVSSSSGVAGP